MAVTRALAMLALIGALAGGAAAQPVRSTSELLREGNAAATAGDWQRVAQLSDAVLQRTLPAADLAEANRLAGIAAFFQQHITDAERHFLAYLRIDLDGRLDPALYPPEVVAFFNDVASRHAAELRAMRIAPQRSWYLVLLPPAGQFQNGERTKGYVLGGLMGAFLAVNLTTYALLRQWCDHTDGPGGGALTCSDGGDRSGAARKLQPYNVASGIGVILVWAYGVYDGIQGYRQRGREQTIQPFVSVNPERNVLGISGSF